MDSFNVNAPAFVPQGGPNANPKESQKQDRNQPGSTLQKPNHDQPSTTESIKNPQKKQSNQKSKKQKPRRQQHEGSNNNRSHQRQQRKYSESRELINDYQSDLSLDTDSNQRRGKVSISHLLDFHLPQRSQQQPTSARSRRFSSNSYGSTNTKGSNRYGGLPPPDTAAYIQTACRFLLNPEFQNQYVSLLCDPDEPVPLDKVSRVLARAGTCPICLDNAKAPRMLKCGHIMCYPCLLRYLDTSLDTAAAASSNTTAPRPNAIVGTRGYTSSQPSTPAPPPHRSKDCPLCFEQISGSQVMPVTFLDFDEKYDTPRPNTDAVLRLMFRPHADVRSNGEATFMNAVPVSSHDLGPALFNCVPVVSPTSLIYSRLILPTKQYLTDEYERELHDLQAAYDEEKLMYGDNGFEDVARYYRHAMSEIKKSISQVSNTNSYDEASILEQQQIMHITPENVSLAGAASSKQHVDSPEHYLGMYDETSAYYFYQTAPQSQVCYFLSPFDIKILLHEYGSYKNFPSSLVVPVLNVVHGHYMSPDLRKRFRYLSHIPDYTEIAFIECDWLKYKSKKKAGSKEGLSETDSSGPEKSLVSISTITHFQKELQQRADQIAKKAKWEKNQAKKFQKMEDMKMRDIIWAEYSGPNSSTWASEHFGGSNNNNSTINGTSTAFPSLAETKAQVELAQTKKKKDHNGVSSTDANRSEGSEEKRDIDTRAGQANGVSDGGIAIFAKPKKKTVWGTDAVVYEKQQAEEMRRAREEALQSGWLDFYKFGTEASKEKEDSRDDQSTKPQMGKKKNKPKKIVLMSTSNSYS